MTTANSDAFIPGARSKLVARLKALVAEKTTEMADAVLEVPLSYYRSDARFASEKQQLLNTPLAIVPSSRVLNAGDYVVREILGISVLVSRGQDGVARAFLNYCRHRGAQVAHGCGTSSRHSCPYHAWTYDSSGQLFGIPGVEGFAGMDKSAHGLVELPTQEKSGFIWAVLNSEASIDVSEHLGELEHELASYQFENYEFLTNKVISSETNWKAGLEAFTETYHFPYVHKDSVLGQSVVGNTHAYDAFGKHQRLAFATQWIDQSPDVDEYPTPLDFVVIVYWVYPNLVLAVTPVGLEIIDILPGSHPTQCTVDHGWMAAFPAQDEATRKGYEELFVEVHRALVEEDFVMLETCGDGVRHSQHEFMNIGRNEIGVQHVVRTFMHQQGLDAHGHEQQGRVIERKKEYA